MKKAWRLFSQFQATAEPDNEGLVMQWVRDTLRAIGVVDRVAESLTHHLMEKAHTAGKECVRIPPFATYQVFVPVRKRLARYESQGWSYFLVIRPAARTAPGDRERGAVIRVFLFPAARG